MDFLLEKRLDRNIFKDSTEYFLTGLTDRFEYLNTLWAAALEKKFGKKFKPIYIQNCKQNKYFKKENYLIVNKTIVGEREKLGEENIIYLEDYEDLNKEFSESRGIKRLVQRLIKKQDRVFILLFTSSFLNLDDSKVQVLGPKPQIATKFDNKIEHIKLFNRLNLPRNEVRIYPSLKQLTSHEKYPYYISAAYTSGGHESGPIHTKEDLDDFKKKLRGVNKSNLFLAAKLIEQVKLSPNVNAIVYGKGKTEIICLSDQVLNGNVYLGNIYPSKMDSASRTAIVNVTKKVGNYLSKIGYRGIFGLDFIIDSKNRLYTVDLNPRRQGGYLCNVLMSKKANLIELELEVATGGNPKPKYDDFQPSFAWAHSKIKPHSDMSSILQAFKRGDFDTPFTKVGSEFECIFYPERYVVDAGNVGYLIVSGNSRSDVVRKLMSKTKELSSEAFSEAD